MLLGHRLDQIVTNYTKSEFLKKEFIAGNNLTLITGKHVQTKAENSKVGSLMVWL